MLALTVIGVSVAWVTTGSGATSTFTPSGHVAAPGTARGFFGGGFANLGAFGTVAGVGTNTFTVTAGSGQTLTVDEQSSTAYYSGATSASKSVVAKGDRVVVQGTRSGNTVTATRVVVLPAGEFGAAS